MNPDVEPPAAAYWIETLSNIAAEAPVAISRAGHALAQLRACIEDRFGHDETFTCDELLLASGVRIHLLRRLGIAVIVDNTGWAASKGALASVVEAPEVDGILILTEISPDWYPTRYSERAFLKGKELGVVRINRIAPP